MDKNNTSNPSVCTKIRQAIHKISSYNQQEPKPITFGSNSTSSTNSPSPIPQHVDNNSTFIPIEQENSSTTIPSAQHGKVAKVSPPFVAKNSETAKRTTTTKVVAKGETQQPQNVSNINMQGRHSTKVIGQHVHHQQGKNKSMDINETFSEYIQRAKNKIRTVSNIGRGQSNPASAANNESDGGDGAPNKEDHREKFSDFIQRTKNKLRTTTIARRK